MDEVGKKAEELRAQVADAYTKLNIAGLAQELARLTKQSQEPDFWNDNLQAQQVMQQIAKLDTRTAPWQTLSTDTGALQEMLQLGDATMASELQAEYDRLQASYDALKEELRYSGAYDGHNVILSIHAGAGGTDAQDWAGMLLRMYIRFAEKQNWKVTTIEESPGEEAGLKSVTIEINGKYTYGYLKGEHGVHRLVRLSPFNAESRETSFAKVEVVPKIDRPDDVPIDEKDLRIDVYRSGGHGGQSVNTTDSAVRVTHLPTGIVVAIQNERSQLQNKELAMTILRSKLIQLQQEQHAEHLSDLKGPDMANEFGSQIRNYVLHPYKQVKDLRSGYETSDPDRVLDGDLAPLVTAYLDYALGQ